ncbi:hypothetical protein AMEX_G27588 [Astyanax mexicanus]|uniref:Uncharacterized protein n=1 Tax=Astyanax mexicanus TaxID=7994 RepID=A0A8T2KKR7_ASTMX|nr:hypothetical protein AMEX_G27588 [Astyanax mexicanus]
MEEVGGLCCRTSDHKEQQIQKTQDAKRAIPDREKRRAVKSGPETPASVLKNEGATKGFLSDAKEEPLSVLFLNGIWV